MADEKKPRYSPAVVSLALGIMLVLILLGIYAPRDIALLLPYLGAITISDLVRQAAAIGILVMALIQTGRLMYPFRGSFHERTLREWLGRSGASAEFEQL